MPTDWIHAPGTVDIAVDITVDKAVDNFVGNWHDAELGFCDPSTERAWNAPFSRPMTRCIVTAFHVKQSDRGFPRTATGENSVNTP